MSDVDAVEPEPSGVPGKPRSASLSAISFKGKMPPQRKSGDLTRLFDMARAQKVAEAARDDAATVAMPTKREEAPVSPVPFEPEVPALAALDLTSAAASDFAEPLTLSLDAIEPPLPELTVAAGALEIPTPPWSPLGPTAEILPTPIHAAAETLAESTHTASGDCSVPRWDIEAAVPLPPAKKSSEPAMAPEPMPGSAQAPAPAAAAVPQAEEAPAPPMKQGFKTLVDYWRFLRGDREFPAASQVDRSLVSERWPSSLLLAFAPNASGGRGEMELAQVTRLGRACADAESAVGYSAYATRWMLELGRAALRACEPVEELARLSTETGSRGFRLLAFPLGPAGAGPDSVLCELTPSIEAPRFGKRRTWLED